MPSDSGSNLASVVDSGYAGQDGDEDSDSRCSSCSGEIENKDTLCHAVRGIAPLVIEGGVSVEHSNHVQVGHTTHYHGPVTLVLSPGKDELSAPGVLPGVLPDIRGDFAVLPEAPTAAKHSPSNAQNTPESQKDGAPHTPDGKAVHGVGVLTSADPDLKRFCRWPCLLVPVGAVVAVVVVAVVLVLVLRSEGVDILPNGVKLVKRAAWNARQPKEAPDILSTPVKTVVIHHSGTEACFYFKDCCSLINDMQQYHMYSASRLWDDIGYNFLVGGDGVVYEGRGWDAVGAHLFGWNRKSLGVALVGTFTTLLPAAQQRDMLDKFLAWGVGLGKIEKDYNMVGACQLHASKSPGLRFMEQLRTSPHWWNYTETANACTE